MSRELAVLHGRPPEEVADALRRALAHEGPAILPREAGADGLAGVDEAPLTVPGGAPLPTRVPQAVALVVETSGSSGVPKRVMLSADALLASAAATESALGGPGQWLLALPTHYVAGLQVLVRSIAAGTAPLAEPPGAYWAPRFAGLVDELDAPRRYTSLVPTQLARLVEAAGEDAGVRRAVARLDAILVGGQALAPALHRRAVDLGFAVVRTYGASETAGGCVYEGRPIGSTVVRVQRGELEISGPSLAEGYLGDDALTRERFHVDEGRRWYRTSDGGSVVADAEGSALVTVTGRLDNVIISGGVKVSLDLVERLVQALPGFEHAVVAPADDATWGQVAVVVSEHEHSPTALAGLRAAVVARAGRAAAPAALRILSPLPLLSSGKPDRVAIARSLQAAPR